MKQKEKAMKNQEILFTSPGIAELQEYSVPVPQAGEVVVRTVRSTISAGTERALVSGDPNVNTLGRNIPFPRQSGYSSSGVVVAVGEGVNTVSIGDRVAVYWGRHARYQCVPVCHVVPLPESISFSTAALAHIACFPLAAMRKCRLEIGESALVMGLGVLGLLAVKILRAAGATPIVAADPVPEKRALALQYGADFALDPLSPDFATRVKELTAGGIHVAIEVTGVGPALDTALDCMRPFGRVSLLGCTRDKNFTIDYYRKVHAPGITLVGAHTNARPNTDSSAGLWTTGDDLAAILRLVDTGRLSLDEMIEEVHSPVAAPELYAKLTRQKFFPLVQFDWDELGEN